MANVSSGNITMFPSSMRTGVDVYSRFTTELNLVDIVNRISSGSFVSAYDSTSGNIEFTIGGYNFRTTYQAIASALGTVSSTENIYVVALTNYGTTERFEDTILKGYVGGALNNSVDSGGNFVGLQFFQATTPTSSSLYQQIVSYVNTENTNNGQHIKIYTLELLHSAGGGSASPQNFSIPEEQQTVNIGIISDAEINALWS